MKKSTIIIICIVYLASIAVISFFGMKVSVYSKVIDVTSVECINTTDSRVDVSVVQGMTVIKTPFTDPFNEATKEGTMIQLLVKVLPDDATTKTVDYIFNPSSRFSFYLDDMGRKTGLIMIYEPVMTRITIISTDGTQKSQEIMIWAYTE